MIYLKERKRRRRSLRLEYTNKKVFLVSKAASLRSN
jgi:hypothetical protein